MVSEDDSVVVLSILTIVDVDTSELRDVAALDVSSVLREDVASSECVEFTIGRASEVLGNDGPESEVVWVSIVSVDVIVIEASSVLMFIDVDSSVLRDTVVPDTSSLIGEDVDPAECVALTLERASDVVGNEGRESEVV